MLQNLTGGIPALSTVDWIEGVSHSNEGMTSSDAGIDKVMHVFFLRNTSSLICVEVVPIRVKRHRCDCIRAF